MSLNAAADAFEELSEEYGINWNRIDEASSTRMRENGEVVSGEWDI